MFFVFVMFERIHKEEFKGKKTFTSEIERGELIKSLLIDYESRHNRYNVYRSKVFSTRSICKCKKIYCIYHQWVQISNFGSRRRFENLRIVEFS
ncbi:hypothetical protein H5410_064087 [Solanum commersonii]|uniref:Uncharacterized protein n=1 Tax=Solanum commersonii TaxID=4109 RepID=A0A9J5W0F4_SOLCO|nr:hypothetical protein H5410_064087 [Solanum commersonii]